jgi:hypothetical protein
MPGFLRRARRAGRVGQDGQDGQEGREGLEKRGSVLLRLEALCGLQNEGSLAVAAFAADHTLGRREGLEGQEGQEGQEGLEGQASYCGRGWNTGSSFRHGVRHGFPLSYNVRFCSSLGTVSG